MATAESARTCQSGQTALAARLLQRFASVAATKGSNLIFSPLSIHVALALMSTGAGGATLDEILAVAGAPSREELKEFARGTVIDRLLADRSGIGGPSVAFACGAWTDRSFTLKPAYRNAIVETFKGSASTVDFANHPVESRKEINAWVAKATRGLITELVDPYQQSATTRNVVVNAIYFKGDWLNPFQKVDTINGEFFRLDGSSVDMPFMRSWDDQYIACHDGFKVLKLPYKVVDIASPEFNWKQLRSMPKFSMCVFLPDARNGLSSLVEKMTSSPEFLHNHLPVMCVPVGKFRLPRFKLSFGRSIVDDLKSLGLVLPFEPSTASVTEMVKDDATDGPIYVEDVIHKAVVDVNEEGCEAAAATEEDDDLGCPMFNDYVPPKRVDFVADHPFAFFIMEETSGAVVFAGHILDPSGE